MRRDGANHYEKLGLREFHVQVNLPSPIQQVSVPIWHVIIPIRGIPNPIRQVVPLISHICSYPPHRFHLHPLFLSFLSTTLLSLQNTKLSHLSQSLHAMIMSWHRAQHTPSTTYTDYSIHRGQHTPSTTYTDYSIHQGQHPPMIVCLPFIPMITSWPLNVTSVSGMPPDTIDCHQPACYEGSKVMSPCHIPILATQLPEE